MFCLSIAIQKQIHKVLPFKQFTANYTKLTLKKIRHLRWA